MYTVNSTTQLQRLPAELIQITPVTRTPGLPVVFSQADKTPNSPVLQSPRSSTPQTTGISQSQYLSPYSLFQRPVQQTYNICFISV